MSISPEDSGISGAFATVAAPAAPAAGDGRGGVFSISFLALVATQFFVALNDNMFRWLVVPIGKELIGKAWSRAPANMQGWIDPDSLALSLGLACFTLPFMLFAAPAGYFADRYSKRSVMVVCKAAEIVLVVLGVAAILLGHVPLMFLVLFLLGAQSTMFITCKLGAIPEIVRSEKISAANGLINMVSMSAIIVGSVAGGWLYVLTKPSGRERWWISASALLGVALCGFVTSLFIGRLKAANPARAIPWNSAAQTVRDLGSLWSRRPLFLAAVGSTYFWAIGALSQVNIDQFVTKHLFMSQECVGYLLGVLTLGIGFGALLAGVISRSKVELGLVPLGGLGIAMTSILLAFVPGGAVGLPAVGGYAITGVFLLVMGVTAGLYDIPLQSFLQDRSPPESRGSIMAAYNFLTFAGMLAASGVYWLLSGPMDLSAQTIFLIGGAVTVPVTLLIVRQLPFHTTRLAVAMLTNCMYRIRVEGLENVPADRGALVVSNHVSWADGVLLGLACPRHPRMVAFADYFNNRWLGWFGRLGRIIPIGTTRKSMVESIRQAREALQNGELVCIFPEGGISRDGELQEFRPGFLSILKDTGAPVVPVYLGGLWGSIFSYEGGKFFWKWPKQWRYPVTIRFGRAIAQPESVEQVRAAVEEMQNENCKMQNAKLHGR